MKTENEKENNPAEGFMRPGGIRLDEGKREDGEPGKANAASLKSEGKGNNGRRIIQRLFIPLIMGYFLGRAVEGLF
jgi:hypothetical protein